MIGLVDASAMKPTRRAADVEALIREIQRYLSYVEALRSHPPTPPTHDERGEDDA